MENRLKYKNSIRKRLIIIMMSISFLTTIVSYSSFVYWYMQNQSNKTLDLAKTVALVLGQDFAKLLLLNDVSSASDITSSLKSFSNLESMVLYDLDRKPVLKYSKTDENFNVDTLPLKIENRLYIKENILTLYINTKYQNKHLGYTQYKFSIETIWNIINKNILSLFFILFFMLIISYFLTIFLEKKWK